PRRSRAALRLTAAAAVGRFELQQCTRCAAVQYPPREACHRCLSVDLKWTQQSPLGTLISETRLFHTHVEAFRPHLPWRLGLVQLASGPTVVAHVHESVQPAPTEVAIETRLDQSGYAVLIARPPGEHAVNDDPRFVQMGVDPRGLKVFVTDATGDIGRALVSGLQQAGGRRSWAGHTGGSQG